MNAICTANRTISEVCWRVLLMNEIIKELNIDKSRMCDCTKAHEKCLWSLFFGKEIDVEIAESIYRGGNDCVIKIIECAKNFPSRRKEIIKSERSNYDDKQTIFKNESNREKGIL